MTGHKLVTVLAWHEALNAGDADRVASLSHPEVEIGGPRGPARGRQVLKDRVGRANVRLEPLRSFRRGETVVVEEAATWRDAQTGETTGAATVATVFELDGGLVSGIFRYDGLEDALRSAGLDGSDETRPENQHNGRIFMQTCTHLDQIRDVETSAEGCEECLQTGDTWGCTSESASRAGTSAAATRPCRIKDATPFCFGPASPPPVVPPTKSP